MPCAIQLALIAHLVLMGTKAVMSDRAQCLPLGGSDVAQFAILMMIGVAITDLVSVIAGH